MMKEMTCQEIAGVCGGRFYGTKEEGERIIAGIEKDSRLIKKDWVFIAIVGGNVDGHSYIPEVLEKGAACAVSEKLLENPGGPYILVESTLQALKDIGAYYRSLLDTKIVGITGSAGKTSTKEMIASVLSVKYSTQKTQGNLNNEIGVPLTLFTIGKEHEAAVVEMGISDFGEMRRLGKMAKPDFMVITNIGQSHLKDLKTRDGILKAKTEVFEEMDDSAEVILNGDDDKLSTIAEVHGKKPHFFSKSDSGREAYATDIVSLGLYGSDCTIHMGNKSVRTHIDLPGGHMVMNAIAAAAVGNLLGLAPEEIAEGISRVRAVKGRGQLVETGRYTLIDETYNANPESMGSAIDLLTLADTRKVAVMGDMFNLGENEEMLHRQTGAYCAKKGIDVIVCIGKLAKQMAEGAREEGAKEVYYFENKQKFLEEASRILKEGDAVLLKASHGMEFEKLLEALK